ncbi:hypothetical protein GCK32_019003 [Trichostrongylus colubriformis]|uniref:TIL domain-containing protein n=1 Tax=Trichostrongylus colubriformis TaxID=6319 RepID=A0AAN8G2C3_TRICO
MLLLCVCQATDNDKRLLIVLVLVVSMNHSAGVVALFYFGVTSWKRRSREMQRTVFILMLIGIGVTLINGEECPENEKYYSCMPVNNLCNLHVNMKIPCVTGCFCKEGYKLNADDKCMPVGPNCK